MVGPTNLNPRLLSSLLMALDSSVSGGMSCQSLKAWVMGFPLTNCQMNLSNDPNSFWICMRSCALLMVAWIFSLFRITSGLLRRRLVSRFVNFAIFSGLKSAKAFLRAALRLSISSQVRPAWKPSRVRSSKSFLSS